MARSPRPIDVYVETGIKRTFAGALDWPGWCRSGQDEESALQALVDYGPRYARVLGNTRLGFLPPAEVSALSVQERLEGNPTTDFGGPAVAPSGDARTVDSHEIQRFEKILKACWKALDNAIEKATGKDLSTGPRGGGRQLEGIVEHLLGADTGYLSQVGWKLRQDNTTSLTEQLEQTRQGILDALTASVHGEIPARGPRGGVRWSPRYFVRRLAWHTLDHVWEIEDRVISA